MRYAYCVAVRYIQLYTDPRQSAPPARRRDINVSVRGLVEFAGLDIVRFWVPCDKGGQCGSEKCDSNSVREKNTGVRKNALQLRLLE